MNRPQPFSKIAIAFFLVTLSACSASRVPNDAKVLRVATLRGQKAEIEKAIELQDGALSDLKAQIPRGQAVPLSVWENQRRREDAINQKLIELKSKLAGLNEEFSVLAPDVNR